MLEVRDVPMVVALREAQENPGVSILSDAPVQSITVTLPSDAATFLEKLRGDDGKPDAEVVMDALAHAAED